VRSASTVRPTPASLTLLHHRLLRCAVEIAPCLAVRRLQPKDLQVRSERRIAADARPVDGGSRRELQVGDRDGLAHFVDVVYTSLEKWTDPDMARQAATRAAHPKRSPGADPQLLPIPRIIIGVCHAAEGSILVMTLALVGLSVCSATRACRPRGRQVYVRKASASGHVTSSHAGHDGPHFKGVRARPGERR
jgi:hypothetical protein